MNVRSLRNKADFITDYARENDIDILCMTETWLTDNDASNNKEMYRIINDLMGRSSKTLFPKSDIGPGALADCFVTHFTDKITDIRVHLATISTQRQLSVFADDNGCRVVDPLCDFELLTCNDICNLVMKSTSKLSTDIDIISATLLKSNIATLAPVLTRIVNLSIESSTMPAVMKHAVVTPLLKKSDLDPEILYNYRPISNLGFISKLLKKYVASQIRQYMDSNDLFDVFRVRIDLLTARSYTGRHSTFARQSEYRNIGVARSQCCHRYCRSPSASRQTARNWHT